MRRVRSLLILSVTAALLAGCATPVAGAPREAVDTPQPTAMPSATSEDAAAAAKADSWLEGAVLPAGAKRTETAPSTTPSFSNSFTAWPCSPMETRTGYWTIDGAGVVETTNWLIEHPTAGLIATVGRRFPADTQASSLLIGNVPEHGSLEGIAYTVAQTPSGVAIRAEIGAFTKTTVCPTVPGGGQWGGPGQG